MDDTTLRILLVDEREDTLISLSGMARKGLPTCPLALGTATSYQEAMDELETHAYDLCLIDGSLVAPNAPTLLHRLQEQQITVPIVVLPPKSEEQALVTALQLGAANLVPIPPVPVSGQPAPLRNLFPRTHLEAALTHYEEIFTAFMGHLPGIAAIRDVQGRYVFANEMFQRLFGVEEFLWRGRTPEEILHPEAARLWTSQEQIVFQESRAVSTTAQFTLRGETMHWLLYQFPIAHPDLPPSLIGSIGIDITDRAPYPLLPSIGYNTSTKSGE